MSPIILSYTEFNIQGGIHMDYKSIGEQVRKLRRNQNLTIEQLAEKVGVSVSFIGHIERGSRKASIETFVKISHALGVSTDMFLPPPPDGLVKLGYTQNQLDKARALLELAIRIVDSEREVK